jgi:plastocyanin
MIPSPLPHCLVAAAIACTVLAIDVPRNRTVVQMTGNRFAPAQVTVHAGDTLRFLNGRGGPHNVQFALDSLPDSVSRALDGAMGNKIGPASGPLLVLEGEAYEFVVPKLPPGQYAYFCLPHLAGGMSGSIVVAP